MNEKEESTDFVREEVYIPQRVPASIRRPNNMTPGQKYKILSEDRPAVDSPSIFHKLEYRVKDDIGRIITVPSCFFEHPADRPLLHEDDEDMFELKRDHFDLRSRLSKAIEEGKARYTEDITYCDMGIDPTRMTPAQAKSEWVRILKIAGIAKGSPKSEFNKIEKVSQNMRRVLGELDSAINQAEIAMFGADKTGK